ncbi:hypothetical protein NDU88_001854 [Pleurodeles waltl]|uniref:Uncharacterized protein n=1 Tax=Pleurodeles waltl TaxID=8319 RepID=A0AAV7S9Y4_PLEWA|nr:hypothetical protein NDU88_001854 [Pleurodeles waltl]
MVLQWPPGSRRGPPAAGSPATRSSLRALAPSCRCGSRSRLGSAAPPPGVFAGRPQRLQGPRPHPTAAPPYRFQRQAPRSPTGRPNTSKAAGRPGWGPSRLRAFAPAPWRLAPQLEAAASITELGHWSLSGRPIRFRPRAPPRVTARAQKLPGQPPTRRSRLGPNRPGDGTLLLDFQVGPSGARDLGVRHLRTLGHAPE